MSGLAAFTVVFSAGIVGSGLPIFIGVTGVPPAKSLRDDFVGIEIVEGLYNCFAIEGGWAGRQRFACWRDRSQIVGATSSELPPIQRPSPRFKIVSLALRQPAFNYSATK